MSLYTVILFVGILVAVMFVGLVYWLGKGDSMSGGGSGVRTSFKGKASFDDMVAKMTLILGVSFMAIMLLLDIISVRTSHS